MARYLIPKPIQRQYELFPGWGLSQIGLVVAGLVVGAICFAGLTALHLGSAPFRLIVAVFFIAVAGFLAFPPPNEQPLYMRLLAGWRFFHAPRRWLYDWNAGDWDE
jgi:hypothetical protein